MRILWLSHFLPYPPTGGALQRTHHLLREMARRHEVHLVALNQRSILQTRTAIAEAVECLSQMCARVHAFSMEWDRSRWRRLMIRAGSFFTAVPYETNWLACRQLQQWLDRHAAAGGFDIVHVDSIGLMRFAAAFRGTPVALTHHNIESQLVRRRAGREGHPLQRLYLRREATKLEAWERRLCPAVAVNITVSALDQDRLKQVVGSVRAAIVENGVDADYFHPGVSGHCEREGLIFAGSLGWFANRDAIRYFLEDIWPALRSDDPRRTMTFVGRDPPPELLSFKDPHVTVTGPVPDVRPYLDAAAIYVCPIRDGGGTRLKVLDALAMGKPVVATSLSVEGLELVPEVHFLQAEEPQEFVAQIRRLEGDSELRRRLKAAGRAITEQRYSWEVIAQKLDRAYQAAIQREASPDTAR